MPSERWANPGEGRPGRPGAVVSWVADDSRVRLSAVRFGEMRIKAEAEERVMGKVERVKRIWEAAAVWVLALALMVAMLLGELLVLALKVLAAATLLGVAAGVAARVARLVGGF